MTKNNFTTKKERVLIDFVKPNPWNPNMQSEKMFAKQKASIDRFGYLQPILVRQVGEMYEILDGEHRWRACKEEGYTEIDIENMGTIPDEDAKLLTVLMNNLKGKDDVIKRAEVLKDFRSQIEAGQLSFLPFDKAQIENELKLIDFDFSQYDKEEEIKEARIRGISFTLSADEFVIVNEALSKAGKDKNTSLVKLAREYLAIRGFINDQGYTGKKEEGIEVNEEEPKVDEIIEKTGEEIFDEKMKEQGFEPID